MAGIEHLLLTPQTRRLAALRMHNRIRIVQMLNPGPGKRTHVDYCS
jgi:hypothetical protein